MEADELPSQHNSIRHGLRSKRKCPSSEREKLRTPAHDARITDTSRHAASLRAGLTRLSSWVM